MVARGHHFGDAPGYLHRTAIDESGIIRVSKFWHERVAWLGEGKNAKDILFRLVSPGLVVGLDPVAHSERINALMTNSEVGASASIVFARGAFQPDPKLTVPPHVASYVLGGLLAGPMWAWACRDALELWNDAVQQARTAEAVAHINVENGD